MFMCGDVFHFFDQLVRCGTILLSKLKPMGIENIWVIGLLIVVIPLFFWMRVKAINKRKKGVTARCPYCEKDQRLSELGNYRCVACKEEVVFFDSDGTVKSDMVYYTCASCGERNFKGILTCTACGLANQAGIPGK